MTTQTCNCTIGNGGFALAFTATTTDDGFTELLDSVDGKHLYEVMLGRTVDFIMGNYAVGGGMMRIRNTSNNNQVKIIEGLPILKGQHKQLIPPIKIEENDIVEVYATPAGS